MNVLETRVELMKLIKVKSRGREIEMQLKTISPWGQGNNASFRGACVEVLIEGMA